MELYYHLCLIMLPFLRIATALFEDQVGDFDW